MKVKTKSVYVIFEERQVSCDSDYGDDGYMIIWDGEEVGRNITIENLSKEIKKCDDELYSKLIKHMKEDLQLNDFNMADDYLTEIMEFLTKETEGIMYIFYYQNIISIKEVHKTEESAKKNVDYYSKNISYNNRFTYCRYTLLHNKPEVNKSHNNQQNKQQEGFGSRR